MWEGGGGGEQVWLLARARGDFTPGSVGERFYLDFDSWLDRGLAGRFDSWLGCEKVWFLARLRGDLTPGLVRGRFDSWLGHGDI